MSVKYENAVSGQSVVLDRPAVGGILYNQSESRA